MGETKTFLIVVNCTENQAKAVIGFMKMRRMKPELYQAPEGSTIQEVRDDIKRQNNREV